MKIEDIVRSNSLSPQQKVAINIRITSNCLSNVQNNFMAKFDLSMPQFNILRILRGAKGALNVHTIKQRMIEKSPNTTRLMDKLIDKNLIQRERCDEDRRVVFVSITDDGLEILSRIDEEFKTSSFVPNSLSDAEAEQLNNLLDKLRESLV